MIRQNGYTVMGCEEMIEHNRKMHRYHVRFGYIGEKRPKVSKAKRKRVYERDKGKCAYCGRFLEKDNFCIDHIIPLSRGGNNEDDNLTVSCRSCNSRKYTKTAEEFREVLKNEQH